MLTMSRVDGRKHRAIMLLSLIIGHSALRTNEATNRMKKLRKAESRSTSSTYEVTKTESTGSSSAEAELQKAGSHCSWSRFKCNGFGCAHRPLPLDTSLSAQCRPSDEYMLLGDNINHFVQVNANLLEEKSSKYKEACTGLRLWRLGSRRQWRCMRYAGHMMRASRFLARSVGEMQRANPTAVGQVLSGHVESAVQNLANASNIDPSLISGLKEKWCTNSSAFLNDPRSHMMFLVGSLVGIASGEEKEVAKVRQHIDAMSFSPGAPSAEKLEEVQEKVVEEMASSNEHIDGDGFDDLFNAVLIRANTSVTEQGSKEMQQEDWHVSSLLSVDPTLASPESKPKKTHWIVRSWKRFLYLPLKVHPVVIMIILTCLSVLLELTVIHWGWHYVLEHYLHDAHHATGGLQALVTLTRYVFTVVPVFLLESFFHVFVHKWKHHAEKRRSHVKNYKPKDPKTFDCDEDIETWQQDWSRRKMIWCCNTESKGCMAPGVPGVPLVVVGPALPSGPSGQSTQKRFFRWHKAVETNSSTRVSTSVKGSTSFGNLPSSRKRSTSLRKSSTILRKSARAGPPQMP